MMLTVLVVLQIVGILVYYLYMMLMMLVVLQIVGNLVYYRYMMLTVLVVLQIMGILVLLPLHDANDDSCATDRGEPGPTTATRC